MTKLKDASRERPISTMKVLNSLFLENNKKRWTAFIWACCLGHPKIVRLMISRGAAQQYLEVKP
jgi:ankyrin repeat protein